MIEVAGQLGGALACAHAAGLVHRDIKPSNVMLAEGAGALATKLIDFGLVHVHGAGETETAGQDSETRVLGTPLFASPEQLREEGADARADLFSLGMTLWYLAVGGAPENGSLSEITASRLSGESYAGRLPETLPPRLKGALARLLEKDPAKRFASATEFLDELGYDAGKPLELSPPDESLEGAATVRVGAEVEAFVLEKIDAPLASEWQTGSRQNEGLTGVTYSATALKGEAGKEAWLHVLHETLVENVDLLWRVRRNAARVAALKLPGLFTPLGLRGYTDGAAIVLEKVECTSLLSVAPGATAGVISEFHSVLEKIAETCDAVSAAWLPGVNLQPADIWLQSSSGPGEAAVWTQAQPKLLPRFLAAREAPELAEARLGDIGSTVTAEMVSSPGSADDIRSHFARLIYRLAAGRNCPAAASLAAQAYVAVPNLSEQANRTLASVIARQLEFPSCAQLLAILRRSEGLAPAATSAASASRSQAAASAPPRSSRRPTASVATGRTSPALVPPPVAHAPARAAEPQSRGPGKPGVRWALIAGAALLVVLVAVVLLFRGAGSGKTTDGTRPSRNVETFPAGTKLRLSGSGVPTQLTAAVAGKEVEAQRSGRDFVVDLAGSPRQFPLEVMLEAPGFKKSSLTVKDSEELSQVQPVSLFRSTGRILFVGLPSDYTHASASMKALLPEEANLEEVRLERADRGTEIRAGGRNAIEVATGVYAINLRGDNGRTVRPRLLPGPFQIKADETETVTLPPAVTGHYSGSVNDPANASEKLELDLTIEDGLTNGAIEERRGNISRRGAWSDGYLDREGMYRATIHFQGTGDANSDAATLALRAVDDKTIAFATPAPDSQSSSDSPPATRAYLTSGELHRSEAAPGP